MEKENRSIFDCIHMFWGCDFCILCGGVYVSCLDFLLAVVAITSLTIWVGSASGLAMHPDEAEKWQKQLDESLIVLIASTMLTGLTVRADYIVRCEFLR